MSVGYGQAKVDIDSKAGTVCIQLRQALEDMQNFAAFLSGKQVADLIGLGYSSDEATLLKTNIGILDEFRQAYQGLTAIPSPVDVRPFAAPFIGVN